MPYSSKFQAVTAIESGDIQIDNVDPEMINTIFGRRTPSKGDRQRFSAGCQLLTRRWKTCWMKCGWQTLPCRKEIVDVLLQSVDALRELLTLAQRKRMDAFSLPNTNEALDDFI